MNSADDNVKLSVKLGYMFYGMGGTTITFGTKLAGAIAVYLSSSLLENVGYDGSLAVQPPQVLGPSAALWAGSPLRSWS